jgi:hypothetical protein
MIFLPSMARQESRMTRVEGRYPSDHSTATVVRWEIAHRLRMTEMGTDIIAGRHLKAGVIGGLGRAAENSRSGKRCGVP